MNRVIIVGNGFDLAHGLRTKYEDFINWYWDKWYEKAHRSLNFIEKDELCEIRAKDNYISSYFYIHYKTGNRYEQIKNVVEEYNILLILSPLLECISKSVETKGWVDIEADYYAMLIECKGKKEKLERLNRDFVVIQNLLVEYLKEVQEQKINESILCDDIKNAMLSPFFKEEIAIASEPVWRNFVTSRVNVNKQSYLFLLKDYDTISIDYNILDDIGHKEYSALLNGGKLKDSRARQLLLPEKIMLLNFNYTESADLYIPQNDRFIVNHIHGELYSIESVIFGYGDESDDEYKAIVKQNDNEYLRHIKTNRYLEADKYRQLLSFINSAPFQICIMGHSCGLSDKTMLNTLFEHDNCVSIKPYYYVNEQGKDNYLDMVQNISRNFTNPQLMRDRVVNKTYCEELPQVTRKQKEEE